MKSIMITLALATCSVLSADYYQDGYGQGACPNCSNGGQYPNQQRYYNDGYRGQGYNDRGNQRQGYYNDRDGQGYDNGSRGNQGYGRDGYYNSRDNQGYGYDQRYNENNRNSGYQDQNYDNGQEDRNRRYDDRSQNNQNRRDQQVPDQEIAKKIQDAIGPGVFSNGYTNVKFNINNGNVTLRGTVETLDDKNKVEDSVKKIDGVKQVDNQVRVAKPTAYNQLTAENATKLKEYETKFPNDKAQTEGDRIINARIEEKLNGGWFSKGYPNIALNTSNGNVIVTGYVDSADDIQKIDDEIKKIEGVKNVNNQVTVRK